MTYRKLILKGYHRLALSGINDIEIEFNDPTLLILGTNGCGKSSLQSEFNMLPPDAGDYLEGGYKYVEREFNGSVWAAEMTKSPSPKYQFYKDGVGLNESRGITMQRELVRMHLGLTPELSRLISGKELFTNMDTGKRKEWFLRICDADYTFAMKLYKDLSGQLRDTKGALKLAKKQLLIETEKVILDEEQKRLQAKSQELQEVIQILLEHKMPIVQSLAQAGEKKRSVEVKAAQLSSALDRVLSQIDANGLTADDYLGDQEADLLLHKYTADKATLLSRADTLSRVHQQHGEIIRALQIANVENTSELTASLERVRSEIDTLDGQRRFKSIEHDLQAVSLSFDHCKVTLMELANAIPDDIRKQLNPIYYQETSEKYTAAFTKHQALSAKQVHDQQKLAALESHKHDLDVTCPKCDHKFSSIYSPSEAEKLRVSISLLAIEINATEAVIESSRGILEQIKECRATVKRISDLMAANPVLESLWSYLKSNKVITEKSLSISDVINAFDEHIQIETRLKALSIKAAELTKQMQVLVSGAQQSLDDSKKICEQAEHDLKIVMQEIDQIDRFVKKVNQARVAKAALQQRRTEMVKVYEEYKQACINELEVKRRLAYNNLINELSSELGSIEAQIKSINSQNQLIAAIKAQIKSYEDNENGLTEICRALSPTDGLIAQGIYAFMEGFVNEVNDVIAKVWTYDLRVLPCRYSGESVELDYCFPLKVPDSPVRSDVSEGSEAMIEMVNFAFRSVAQKIMKCSHWPLMLDEFSRNFDDSHRNRAMHYISELINTGEFSQTILISHYEGVYGALQNASICLLDDSNLVLPKMNRPINEFVKINQAA